MAPSWMITVALVVPVTQGMPNSRATTEAWESMPPELVTRAEMRAKKGVQG